jgi:hypothetical protein
MAWYLIKLMDNTDFIVSDLMNIVLISADGPRRSATENNAVCSEQHTKHVNTLQCKRIVSNVNAGAAMH